MKCDFLGVPWKLKDMGLSVILAASEDEEAMVMLGTSRASQYFRYANFHTFRDNSFTES